MNFNKLKYVKKFYDIVFSRQNKNNALKKLITFKKKSIGRNYTGKITFWHRGGGAKQKYRIIYNNLLNCYKKQFLIGIIKNIEYDPYKTSFIAQVILNTGAYIYIPASSDLKKNSKVVFSSKLIPSKRNKKKEFFLRKGNLLKLSQIPLGSFIHNIEEFVGKGSKLAKSAGTFGKLLKKNSKVATIILPSNKIKYINVNCTAFLGTNSNIFHKFHKNWKAGTNRHKNKRPIVRGVAMNPIDHPHGGGEGKTSGGRPSVSPWGKLTKCVKTRNKHKIKVIYA